MSQGSGQCLHKARTMPCGSQEGHNPQYNPVSVLRIVYSYQKRHMPRLIDPELEGQRLATSLFLGLGARVLSCNLVLYHGHLHDERLLRCSSRRKTLG